MKVSVIILVYNQEATIAHTIDSVIAQNTDFPIEIIIGDDASTDSTRNVCQNYADRYPHIIRLMPPSANKGVVRNYYDCLLSAHGEYIADCSGDDYWLDPGFLQRMADILDSNPAISLAHSAFRRIYPDSTFEDVRISSNPVIFTKDSLTLPLLRRDYSVEIILSAALYRRSLVANEIKLNPALFLDSLNSCEDLPIWILAARLGDIAYSPVISLAYNVSESSISAPNDFGRHALFRIATLRQTIALQRWAGISDPDLKNYYKGEYAYILAQIFRSGNPSLLDKFRSYTAGKAMPASLKSQIYTCLIRFMKSMRVFRAS